jgi:hypothetical protein
MPEKGNCLPWMADAIPGPSACQNKKTECLELPAFRSRNTGTSLRTQSGVREAIPPCRHQSSVREAIPPRRHQSSVHEAIPPRRHQSSVREAIPPPYPQKKPRPLKVLLSDTAAFKTTQYFFISISYPPSSRHTQKKYKDTQNSSPNSDSYTSPASYSHNSLGPAKLHPPFFQLHP